jgi:hypothetical protein
VKEPIKIKKKYLRDRSQEYVTGSSVTENDYVY